MKTILVSAYACEPLKGSEQGVGWNWVLQLAKKNNVHVITRANNKSIIEKNIPNELSNNLFFYYYDAPNSILKLKKRAKGLYFYNFAWQLGIVCLIRSLKNQYKFDYFFQPTLGSLWMMSVMPFFNIPFIWGPLGGGEGVPYSFLKNLPIKDRILQSFRYFLKIGIYLNPLLLFILYRSKVILVRTNDTLLFIPKFLRQKTKIILETSIENDIFENEKIDQPSSEVNLIITGRLVPFKNVITAIKSLEYLPINTNFKLKIIGSGSEKEKIEIFLKKCVYREKVELIAESTRQDVLNFLCMSDIYLFPSLREGGSWALMEAMAIGLPVICLKWSGMEVITDDASAIRLPVTNPEQMPKDMAMAICKLIENPELMRTMGEAGRNRIRNEFNWDSKGQFMEELFKELETK